MNIMALGTPVLFMAGLGALAAAVLVFASQYLQVESDPRIDQVCSALPGLNCGACGYSSCAAAAEAVVQQKAGPDVCLIGGNDTLIAVEEILQVKGSVGIKKIAYLCCSRNVEESGRKMHYNGPSDCFSTQMIFGGEKKCDGGCVGMGSCVSVCPVDAITMNNGLPFIDTMRCTGCGICVKTCPKKIIALLSDTKSAVDRKKCGEFCVFPDLSFSVDTDCCIKCGLCAKQCPVDAITWEKGSPAFINRDRCIECLTCMRVCPPGVIS